MKNGLFGRHLLGVGDEADRAVDQILGEVIPLFGRLLRLDRVVVVDQLGIILVRVAAQEAVVAFETAAERPSVVGPGGARLLARGQVPLAERVGVVPVLLQDLGEEPVLERNVAVAAGVSSRALGDAGHRVGMVVASRKNARTSRRAQRGRVHVHEPQSALGQRVEIRRGDWAAVAAKLSKAGVVLHDEEHVRGALLRAQRLRP